MNDPRDDFETIYATLFQYDGNEDQRLDLDGRIAYAKSMRSSDGGYEYNDHLQDCFNVYLMAISKNKGE